MIEGNRVHAPAAAFASLVLAVALAATSPSPIFAQEDPRESDDWSEALDAIRDDLVQLRLEQVLAETGAWLDRRDLPEDARVEAWVLRSQAHVALGDLEAVERDFEAILGFRPEYEPERSLMTPAALERFAIVRDRVVGSVRVEIVPDDATLTLSDREDREVRPDGEDRLRLVAGSRRIRIERPGYDAWEDVLEVQPGAETSLQVRLVPNARTVRFRTSVDEVDVLVDGRAVGRTRVPVASTLRHGDARVAELVVEYLPLGEHAFTFAKTCFRTVRQTRILNVDVLDPSALTLPTVGMEPARAPLLVTGTQEGARITVDGDTVARVPTDAAVLCPGEREIDVRVDDHVVYRARVTATEGVPVRLDVSPRPNVVIVGAEDWPVGFEAVRDRTNRLASMAAPDRGDLSRVEGWRSVRLPDGAQLALAVVPAGGSVGTDRWYLYSPILETVERLDSPDVDPAPPRWTANAVGLAVLDSPIAGEVRVVHVRPGGPAASAGLRVGDRLVEVDGEPLLSSRHLRARISRAAPGATIGLRVEGADGTVRELPLVTEISPNIARASSAPGSATWLAAWAMQSAIARPGDAAIAWAVLARVLEDHGREEDALDAWRRARLDDRPGIGAGTVAYHLGRLLQRAGRDREAIEAFRVAARSEATLENDDGLRVAPAAVDHLADLGVRETLDPFTTR